MLPDLTTEFQNLLKGRIRLHRRIDDLRAAYKSAKPFPHVVMDDFFPAELLEALLSEMAQMPGDQWSNIEQDARERTTRMRSAVEISAAGTEFLSIIHSSAFLYLLAEITEVPQLLPDPYLQGAGYALMRRGDYFSVHADRNVAYETGLTRRLAMIVFLNKEWSPAYHGELELWSPDGKHCETAIEPVFNRTILFQVAYPNFHGVPTPLKCPADRARQSFISYYHTAGVGEPAPRPHSSIFAPRFYGTNRLTLRSLLRDVTPPLLVRAIRKLSGLN